MKCTVFAGAWYQAQAAFNVWAKGKALTREVLIHTVPLLCGSEDGPPMIAIFVYHPEGKPWDATQPELRAPIHDDPVPHIHVEESEVVQ